MQSQSRNQTEALDYEQEQTIVILSAQNGIDKAPVYLVKKIFRKNQMQVAGIWNQSKEAVTSYYGLQKTIWNIMYSATGSKTDLQ